MIYGQLICMEGHGGTDKIQVVNGDLISGATEYELLNWPIGLQDVIEVLGNGLYKLRCDCKRQAWMRVSAQEWLKTPAEILKEQGREEISIEG
jgi:hypothetical protein